MAAELRSLSPQAEQTARDLMDGVLDLVAQLAAARSEIAHLRETPRPLLTLAQAATFLGLSTREVQRLVSAGELPKIALGEKSQRIAPADLDAFIAARRVVAGSRAGRVTALTRARR